MDIFLQGAITGVGVACFIWAALNYVLDMFSIKVSYVLVAIGIPIFMFGLYVSRYTLGFV